MSGGDRAGSPEGRIRSRSLAERTELLDLLAADPEAIESGLRLIERDLDITPHDRADLLLAESAGRAALVIADLVEREHFPLTALDLRRAAHRAAPLLARLFPSVRFDIRPRILVVAARFSARSLARLRFLANEGAGVEVLEVRAAEIAGRTSLLFERIVPTTGQGRRDDAPSAAAATAEGNAVAPEASTGVPPLTPVLRELKRRARERILRLSDEVVSEPLPGGVERFLLGHHVVAEIRIGGEDSLEVGAGSGGLAPKPVFSNADLEGALGPVIRRFFALYRQHGTPAAPNAAVEAPAASASPPAPPPSSPRKPASPSPARSFDLKPVPLTEEEIDELYRDEAPS